MLLYWKCRNSATFFLSKLKFWITECGRWRRIRHRKMFLVNLCWASLIFYCRQSKAVDGNCWRDVFGTWCSLKQSDKYLFYLYLTKCFWNIYLTEDIGQIFAHWNSVLNCRGRWSIYFTMGLLNMFCFKCVKWKIKSFQAINFRLNANPALSKHIKSCFLVYNSNKRITIFISKSC